MKKFVLASAFATAIAMGLPLPDQVLDQRFFQVTGLVMVLATLMAGAITLTLASQMGEAQSTVIIAETTERDPAVLLGEAGGQVAPAVMPERIGFQQSSAPTPRW